MQSHHFSFLFFFPHTISWIFNVFFQVYTARSIKHSNNKKCFSLLHRHDLLRQHECYARVCQICSINPHINIKQILRTQTSNKFWKRQSSQYFPWRGRLPGSTLYSFSYICNLFKHFFLYVYGSILHSFSCNRDLFKKKIFTYICLMLNYHTFNLSFIHLHVTLMIRFRANFLLRTIKYYFIVDLEACTCVESTLKITPPGF